MSFAERAIGRFSCPCLDAVKAEEMFAAIEDATFIDSVEANTTHVLW
jgi:hypothetical protein